MKIKNILSIIILGAACTAPIEASAQFNLGKAVKAVGKAAEAITLTDDQMAAYAKQSVDWMDKNNPVLPEENEYVNISGKSLYCCIKRRISLDHS